MNKKTKRNFLLGDEWLYYKIYVGTKTADTVLLDVINPVVSYLLKEKIIDKWFFIRYTDPKFHLRIRFHCTNSDSVGIIIRKLFPYLKNFSDEDLIWKTQTDTYQRELERYGESTIEHSESIFFQDSTLILKILEIIREEDEELRWLFALKNIDNLLNNFRYTIDDKLSLLERLKVSFGSEYGMDKNLNKQIDFKYRNFRHKIEEIIPIKNEEVSKYSRINNIIIDYNNNISPIIETILEYKNSNLLNLDLNNLISSYIHMSMVRLFKSKNRLHEMVVYDFLFRYYKSYKARSINA